MSDGARFSLEAYELVNPLLREAGCLSDLGERDSFVVGLTDALPQKLSRVCLSVLSLSEDSGSVGYAVKTLWHKARYRQRKRQKPDRPSARPRILFFARLAIRLRFPEAKALDGEV